MYSESDLTSAVQAGVISEQAADALRQHVAARNQAPQPDDEQFRLVTGFNDIFVVIACVLLMLSVKWIAAALSVPAVGGLGIAGVAWLLAEFFVRRRRMALPAIVLLLAFVGGVFGGVLMLLGQTNSGAALAGAAAAAGAALHWWRFGVPITVAAGAAALTACIGGVLLAAVPGAAAWVPALIFVAGVAVFTLAMAWDSADTRRATRRSDVAFWLHLLAAPMLVHPVFTSLASARGETQLLQAGAVVLLYVVIALVSLAIDRRALMVSALAYVLFTFSAILKAFGVVSLGFAVTALVIGSALLLLSAFWHRSRVFVLRLLPASLQRHLPAAR